MTSAILMLLKKRENNRIYKITKLLGLTLKSFKIPPSLPKLCLGQCIYKSKTYDNIRVRLWEPHWSDDTSKVVNDRNRNFRPEPEPEPKSFRFGSGSAILTETGTGNLLHTVRTVVRGKVKDILSLKIWMNFSTRY